MLLFYSICYFSENVQNEPAIFGPQKPVSKAFLRGLSLEIHPTLVTPTFRKVAIPKLSGMEPFLDISSDKKMSKSCFFSSDFGGNYFG